MGQPLTNARNWYNATEEIGSGSGGSVSAWGDLTGTLSDQTDLQAALDAKAASSHEHSGADITSGTVAANRLGTGSGGSSKFLREDNTWQTIAGGVTAMSDLSDVGTVTPTNKHVVVGNAGSTAFESRQLALADLSDATGVSGADDDIMQRKSGAWTNRTLAQLKTDLAASTTTAGVSELAIASEVTTGSDATRAVTPDALAGSTIFGVKTVVVQLNSTTALTTSDKAYFRIPAALNGMNLIAVGAACGTGAAGSSSSGTPTFTVKNVTDNQQMLSTSLTIDANEYTSATAATAAVINTTYDDVTTDDLIEVACTVAGTGVTYATVTLSFQLP